jgi:methionyl-tRNA formyltransferase
MRILCCLNDDVVSNVAFNLLLPTLATHEVCVGLSTRIGGAQPDEPPARRQLRVAEQLLAADVMFPLIERADSPDRGRYLTFREIERHRGVRVSALPNPNAGDGLAFLTGFAPDLIVSIRYGAIFKAPAIVVPRLGVLNLHAGVLPAYRGVIASFRALMARERELGCTLHFIADGTIDTGPVVAQVRVPVDPRRSLFAHVLSLYPASIPVVADAIARLARGETLETRVQSGGAYYSYPTSDEWDEFVRRGWRVADPDDFRELFARYLPSGRHAEPRGEEYSSSR